VCRESLNPIRYNDKKSIRVNRIPSLGPTRQREGDPDVRGLFLTVRSYGEEGCHVSNRGHLHARIMLFSDQHLKQNSRYLREMDLQGLGSSSWRKAMCKTAIVSYSLLQHNNPYTMQITQCPPKSLPRTLNKTQTRRNSQLFRNCNNTLWSKLRFHENQLDCHRRKNLIENTVIKLKF